MHETVVTRWFGVGYYELHPLLQALHREGGTLRGNVDLRFGSGLAGWVGRRAASRLGLPATSGTVPFEVRIVHEPDALRWNRRFGESTEMRSLFRPIGRWPQGCWIEETGSLRLHLGVDVADGGWRWCCRRVHFKGIRIPLWLFPRTRAYKRVEGGRYRFEVEIALPMLGPVLAYGGLLDAAPAA